MPKGVSPLVGYNTNVRHKNRLYHIQTEDSGIQHPHIITHLFADGGRIIASKKTSYAEHVGRQDLHKVVKQLMQEQHKAMFIALRDCVYDEDGDDTPGATVAEPMPGEGGARESDPAAAALDVARLDRAAEARAAESTLQQGAGSRAATSDVAPAPGAAREGSGRYRATVPANPAADATRPAPSIFGDQLLAEKSLDEVILSYLADDVDEPGRS